MEFQFKISNGCHGNLAKRTHPGSLRHRGHTQAASDTEDTHTPRQPPTLKTHTPRQPPTLKTYPCSEFGYRKKPISLKPIKYPSRPNW